MVVVELEGADPGGVGLESQHKDVAHEAHVFDDILGVAVFRPGDVRLGQGRAPALEFPAPAGVVDAFLDLAHRVEVLVELLLVTAADPAPQVVCVLQHGIENAPVATSGAVLEKLVKGEGGVDFQRCRSRWAGPRDMRAVEHRIILVDRGVRLFAAQHQARNLRLVPDPLSNDLIDAGSTANRSARCQRGAGEQVAGLRTVDVSLQGLGVVEPADENHLFAEIVQRGQDLTEFHRLSLAPGPPLVLVKAAPGKENCHPGRCLACIVLGRSFIAPHPLRFHPGKGHADSESAEHGAAGKLVIGHLGFAVGCWITTVPGQSPGEFSPRIIRNWGLLTIISTARLKR